MQPSLPPVILPFASKSRVYLVSRPRQKFVHEIQPPFCLGLNCKRRYKVRRKLTHGHLYPHSVITNI